VASPEVSENLLSLVAPRRGHFRLESGHHSGLWLDLSRMFIEPRRVQPFVVNLARAIQPYDVAGVCGPLVGGALLAQMLASALDVEFFFTERELPRARDGLYGVRYRLPDGVQAAVRGRRIAIVDDAISAGSAVRGTLVELEAHGAETAVVATLLLLGSAAAPYFTERGLPLEAVARVPFELWVPAECPLCASGAPFEDPSTVA